MVQQAEQGTTESLLYIAAALVAACQDTLSDCKFLLTGLQETGRMRSSETVLVTAGAGEVG